MKRLFLVMVLGVMIVSLGGGCARMRLKQAKSDLVSAKQQNSYKDEQLGDCRDQVRDLQAKVTDLEQQIKKMNEERVQALEKKVNELQKPQAEPVKP
jgi:peptidoglycan hydrolase CwlO-like protein